MKKSNVLGKILYGSLFVILIPVALWQWAINTEEFIKLPAVNNFVGGLIISVGGLALILWGMLDLWVYGKGLPMNAYPPKVFVTQGVYRFLSHPIYVGAGILSIGLSIYSGSASGLWLVSPLFILGMTALVLGYEKEAIETIFKPENYRPLISIPPDIDKESTRWEKWSFALLVLMQWLILYELITFNGIPTKAIETYFSFEDKIPVLAFTEIIYLLAYPFVILLPFFIKNSKILRSATIAGILMNSVGLLLQFFLPLVASYKPFNPDDYFGKLLTLEREWTSPAGAFPSFHVAWAFFAAYFYAKTFPKWGKLFYFFAVIISVSCLTTGMHSLSDVLAGWVLFYFSVNYSSVWTWLKTKSEWLANSYQEFYLGKMRIISHAIFPGIAGFSGIFITSLLTNQPIAVFIICICSIIVAGLWAQIIEGSAKLSRPFGFFGGFIGGLLGILLVSKFFSIDLWLLFGAFTVASPWVQGSGRCRCWVQGCCHGKITTPEMGICYRHPRSRVLVISNLGELPLHNTQLYSVLSCFIIGFILSSLWYRDVSMPIIAGLYLILTGLSRFVEEHYRGEPQTPIYYGLRLYQWLAILFVASGIIFTTIKYETVKPVFSSLNLTILFALAFGFIAAFLMGMDFPFSNRRFSRLASVD